MVVALRRGPNDAELSPFLAYRNHLHAALHRVQDAVSAEPQLNWNVTRMAEKGHTSARHLARLFMEHADIAPHPSGDRAGSAAVRPQRDGGRCAGGFHV